MTYLLFAGPQYYPAGGWSDFVRAFASHEAAQIEVAARGYNDPTGYYWWHIVNADTHHIVEHGPEPLSTGDA